MGHEKKTREKIYFKCSWQRCCLGGLTESENNAIKKSSARLSTHNIRLSDISSLSFNIQQYVNTGLFCRCENKRPFVLTTPKVISFFLPLLNKNRIHGEGKANNKRQKLCFIAEFSSWFSHFHYCCLFIAKRRFGMSFYHSIFCLGGSWMLHNVEKTSGVALGEE